MIKTRGNLVNATAALQHPLADEVSIAIGEGSYSRFPHTVELAFFKNGEWQNSILDVFAPYWAEGVYAYVPLTLASQFIDNWTAKN